MISLSAYAARDRRASDGFRGIGRQALRELEEPTSYDARCTAPVEPLRRDFRFASGIITAKILSYDAGRHSTAQARPGDGNACYFCAYEA